ncbi:MAG: DNA topoisomerase IB [Acidobacteriia bacterium]|nr:DNA topoisomerase IB [Terriglobia bacterium]
MFASDPSESAEDAGLRYVTACGPCIQRIRCGKGFRYVGPDGKTLTKPEQLARIRALAIPPAWSKVWICPSPKGHLQAVGWDAKWRKQYRYHALYREVRDQSKFSRMIAFGTVLALVRKRVEEDLKRPGLPKEKVLATVVRLLETTFIRVGNEEYAKENESFGLTTMHNKHVRISGAKLMFRFRGKSGVDHSIELTDRRLAHVVKQCRDLPGYELFQYVGEDGEIGVVDSSDVNRYIREISGHDFTAKDFRTWAGTILAVRELNAEGPCRNAKSSKRPIISAVKRVAQKLGNRPSTCRKYYVHPAILDAYADGVLFQTLEVGVEQDTAYSGLGLRPEEYAVMVIVARHQEEIARAARSQSAGTQAA